jgi:hypothetical protein
MKWETSFGGGYVDFFNLKLVDNVAALFRFATCYEASGVLTVASQSTHNLTYISFLTI